MVACIVPATEYDELYIEQLEKAVKLGHRRRFTWFSKKDLIDLINENTGKSGGKGNTTKAIVPLSPSYLNALESARKYLDNKEEVPSNVIAQLIKGKLIHIKAVEKEKEILRAVYNLKIIIFIKCKNKYIKYIIFI